MQDSIIGVDRVESTSKNSTTPASRRAHGYIPSLDGLRAFSVLFVIYEHIQMPQASRFSHFAISHFHGWLGVDVFFVLSGFLITAMLLREEEQTGSIDMAGFYIRRAFRILPLYWLVLAVYIVILQAPSELDKWMRMKSALPYFLTLNNDVPLLLMPERMGITFGLSWTLGIEEKFYLVWPLVCFMILNSTRTRLTAAVAIYSMTLVGAIFCFPMGRAYAGLVVGAILAIVLSCNKFSRFKDAVRKFPPGAILALVIVGFVLVDVDKRLVFVFSWTVSLLVASLVLNPSGLSRSLSNPVVVWFGKRSYAMYLIQGFAIRAVELTLKPNGILEEALITLGSFGLASVGAALLHLFIEEPARKLGRAISARRSRPKMLQGYSTE